MISRPIDPKRRDRMSGVHSRAQRTTAGGLAFLGLLGVAVVAVSYPIATAVALALVGGAVRCGRWVTRTVQRRSAGPSGRGSLATDSSAVEE